MRYPGARSRAGIGLASTAAVTAAVLGLAGTPAAGQPDASAAGKKKTVSVKVADDFFSPIDLKVKQGTKIKWKWQKTNLNPHNVFLDKGPKGVKKKDFQSATGSIGVKFNRVMEKPGTYDFHCTIHATTMKQTVKVTKKKKKKKRKR